jgi:hypothetical protein
MQWKGSLEKWKIHWNVIRRPSVIKIKTHEDTSGYEDQENYFLRE